MNKKMDLYVYEETCDRLLRSGGHALHDYELVAAMLGDRAGSTDPLALSRAIIALIQSDDNGFELQRLFRERGVEPAQTAQILAAVELTRRHADRQEIRITSGHDVSQLLHQDALKYQYCCITLTLDVASRLIHKRVIKSDSLDLDAVHPREVFADAVADRAAGIIVAHNRGGAGLNVGTDVLQLTRRLKDVGKLVGIELIDHVILTKRSFLSLREKSML